MSFRIYGTGSCLPEKTVTNDDLAAFLDTNDQWIRTRTGIASRQVLSTESLLSLAETASLRAMENAGVSAADIGAVIFSTLQGDYISPSMCCLLSAKLGISCGRMLDINMACSGFLYALDAADSVIGAKKAELALVVCSEGMSRLSDWTDRSTCILFGDGAGAAVVGPGEGCREISFRVTGVFENLYIGRAAGNSPYEESGGVRPYLYMNGQEIYKFAVEAVTSGIEAALQRNGLSPDDIKYYLLHQANMRIISSAISRLGQSEEKFPHNVERRGNTSSASVPILLDEVNRAGLLNKGDLLMLSAFGAGLASAECIIAWGV